MQRESFNLSGGGVSWAVIVIVMIAFWPAGVYLLYRKISSDRVAKLNDGKILRIAGIILIVIGGLQLLQSIFSDRYYSSGMSVFYLLGGLALVYVGKQMKDTSTRYRQYIDIVANREVTDIGTIASLVGVDYDTCAKDLQKMIESQFFHDAYIDVGQGRLIIRPRVYAPASAVPVYAGAGAPAMQSAPRAMRCPSCGANNTVMGGISECEYCGSPLS